MPLTKQQQQQLADLQAEQSRPEPRTETGLAGILHTVLDVVSGAVPHLAAETWADLHSQVEGQFGEQPAEPAADEGQAADDSGASSSSKGASSSSSSSPKSPKG